MLRKRSTALLASALTCLALAAMPAGAEAQVSLDECGSPIAKRAGGYWTCTFADNFAGWSLDRTNWSVLETQNTGFSHGYECYVDDPSTVDVANGSLRLTARRLASPKKCGLLFPTRLQSGMVHTKDTFAQAYGRFEARIRFPRGTGFHSAWWMWPRDMAYRSQSGEIDIAEYWGTYPTFVSPYVHIKDGLIDRGDGHYCTVSQPTGSFHKYTFEWSPLGGMEFSYDGVPCWTFSDWNPGAPLVYPQPFDQPFFMLLTLALQFGAVLDPASFPATMYVDYVRAWS
jgi:beta-glucanase (GH16 family)